MFILAIAIAMVGLFGLEYFFDTHIHGWTLSLFVGYALGYWLIIRPAIDHWLKWVEDVFEKKDPQDLDIKN